MFHEYGIWDRSLGPPESLSDWLLDSWTRRRRFEWEQQAIHIVNTLAKAMSGETDKRQMASDAFMKSLGFEVNSGG